MLKVTLAKCRARAARKHGTRAMVAGGGGSQGTVGSRRDGGNYADSWNLFGTDGKQPHANQLHANKARTRRRQLSEARKTTNPCR